MSTRRQLDKDDESCFVNVLQLSNLGVADLRALCEDERLPVAIRLMLQATPQEYVQVVAPYPQMLHYVLYAFNRDYTYHYELGTP